MSNILVEESLRSPEWRPGSTLVLANGETFHFRTPTLRLWREPGPDGVWRRGVSTNFGPEFDAILNDCEELAYINKDIFEHIYYFADRMLVPNYRPEIRFHYRDILYFSDETAVKNMWWAIYDMARGLVPKGHTSTG